MGPSHVFRFSFVKEMSMSICNARISENFIFLLNRKNITCICAGLSLKISERLDFESAGQINAHLTGRVQISNGGIVILLPRPPAIVYLL